MYEIPTELCYPRETHDVKHLVHHLGHANPQLHALTQGLGHLNLTHPLLQHANSPSGPFLVFQLTPYTLNFKTTNSLTGTIPNSTKQTSSARIPPGLWIFALQYKLLVPTLESL